MPFLYGLMAVVGLVIAALALVPSVAVIVDEWSRSDIQLRSKLLFNSIRDRVASHLADPNKTGLASFFERLTEDETLLGFAYCSDSDQLRFATKLMPAQLTCEKLARSETPSFSEVNSGGRSVLVATFPISVQGSSGHVVILHDLSFIGDRAAQARFYWAVAILGTAFGLGLIGSVLVFALLNRWRQIVHTTLREARAGSFEALPRDMLDVLGPDLRRLMRELRPGAQMSPAIQVDWSPITLQRLLSHELPGADVIVVSNREPYIHNRVDGNISLQIPASGLVAALEPVMRACGGTWIAHGSGTADRETVDKSDRILVPPSDPSYSLRRVWLSEEEQAGYYYGFANEGLWPLCHICFVRPSFREQDWQMYRSVNARFAETVAREARRPDPIVLVQDYHFAILPQLLRRHLPRATIVTFWHIPWPNAETFSICPWKHEIIEGLLGSDVLGFHTQFHCNNFIETVDRFVESRIDRERISVSLGGHETAVRPYPISIEWPPAALSRQKPISECRQSVRDRLSLPRDIKLAVGVERFDYTKGVLDRLRGVDELLTRHPEWRGRFVFVQAAAPTRSQLASYRDLQDEAKTLAADINARHAANGTRPIELVIRHHEPDEVFELFRASDICVVSSLHDGMNLVAKEFVAARDDELGVLILSHFAGASRELAESLIVNPYDAHGLGEAMHQALTMAPEEQRARMKLMRTLVREHNVYRWAGQMLLDAAQLRRKQKVLDLIERGKAMYETDFFRQSGKLRSSNA